MIDRIIEFSVRNKLIVGLMMLLLIAAGIYSAKQLPVDAVPDITNNQVLIITVSPSLAAPEVERLITAPTERLMASLPQLKEMRSISRFGLSNVTVVFEDGVDITKARQQVSERLNQLKRMIPPGIGEPDMGPVTTGLGEVYQYYVVPKPGYEDKFTLTDLRTLQEWIVRRQLLGVPGVADVSSLGGKLKQYHVVIDPARIKSLGITLDELFNAVQQNNENAGGAYIEKGPNAYYIRTEGMATSLADLRSMPVKNVRGIPLKLGDVAEVKEGSALRFGAMYNNKYGEVSGAVVLMLKGANALEVVKKVKARVEEIKKRLPEGVTILPYYERSKMVDNSISTVKRNLIEGALIVIFVLVLFLGNIRSGLVVASVIPLSMLFALIIMNLFHVSANLMSLGALDFGLIVDGAVIIVEGVMHRFKDKIANHTRAEFSEDEINDEVKQSASRLMNAAIFGQIIILVVYLPILSLEGIEGKMFRPMAETVAFALVGAFFLSLTYVPMMTALTMRKKAEKKTGLADKMMAFLQKHYSPLLNKGLSYPKTVILIAVVLFGVAFMVFRSLGGEFIPQLEEGDFAIDARFLPGTSLTQTIKGMKMASDELKKFPEVQQVTCRIGSAEIPTDPMSLEQCDVFVTLNDKSTWTTAHDYAGLEDTMGKRLAQIPGLNVGFEYPVQMRFNELISGAKQDVVVKIFGDDLQQLAGLAGKVSSMVGGVNGATDVYTEKITGLPQLVVHYNRIALAQYNVSVSQVNHIINATFAGEKAGNIYEEEKQFDVMLRIADTARGNFDHIGQLLINTPAGNQVPLSQLATISIKDGPNQIQRENGERRISVSFNVRGRDVEGVVKELQSKVTQLKMPEGYHVEYGGQFENLNSAKKRLSIAVPASLFFIFILLYFAFNQFREALIVFSAIPLAATGGVFALWLRGMAFSISAGVGFIALFGVAVLNGIVLISEFNRLKAEGEDDLDERIRKGTANRLRPVLMTATVASLGFFPMAISTHAGAEVQRPLATVVIGGLITATLLTLVVLPALYKQFAGSSKEDEKKKKQGKKGATVVTTIILLLLAIPTLSQPKPAATITVNDAVKQALMHNLSLLSAQNQTEAAKANSGTFFDIPKTQVTYDVGKINSTNLDNRVAVNQNIALPGYYINQHKFLTAESAFTALQYESLSNQVAYQVRDVYLQMTTTLAKLKLLNEQDSVYTEVIKLEKLRFELGETSRLNLTSAEAKEGMLKNQMRSVQTELSNQQSRLQVLMSTGVNYLPAEQSPPSWQIAFTPDSAAALNNPEVRQAKQQVAINEFRIKVNQAKSLPEVTLGYSNQSFAGPDIRNSNRELTTNDRFSSYMVGLNIPIFARQYRSAVRSAEFQRKSAVFALNQKQLEWLGQWRQAIDRYRQQQQALNYYESSALKQARELVRTATLSFQSGGISYLEWANLYSQSVQLRQDRLDALQQLDQTINTLWYYQGQNDKP